MFVLLVRAKFGAKCLNLFRINWQGQAAQRTSIRNGQDVAKVVVIATSVPVPLQPLKSTAIESTSPKMAAKSHCIVEPLRRAADCGGNADTGFSRAPPPPVPPRRRPPVPSPIKEVAAKEKQIKFADVIDRVVESCNAPPSPASKSIGAETTINGNSGTATASTTTTTVYQTAIRLSPRLEMRLALNHDILGDEDLISFEPGPANLEAILGRDLSSYHRFTGRDLISLTSNHHRIAPKEANISFSTQKNSKMDTPTPNRRKTNPNTWNNSACAVAG